MRFLVVMALALLAGCVTDRLALAPPPGVDFSGYWRLNVEDSDDPLHLIQTQNQDATKAASGSPGQGGQGGQGGRGGRGGRGGGGYPGGTIPGPATPAFSALSEALRWPGKEVEIKQNGGIVTIASSGVREVYTPVARDGRKQHHIPADDAGGRDMPARDRGPPPTCGWDEKTLVVQSAEADDDVPPFEKRYNLSDDGQRLIEVVDFKGGRSGGFTTSRVWDRVVQE